MTDDASKWGCTSVIFVDQGVDVDGHYYCDFLLSQQLLPAIRQVSSKFIFQKTVSYRARCFQTIIFHKVV